MSKTVTTKLYAIVGSYDYEGSNAPEAIFDSRKKAENFIKSGKIKRSYDRIEIEEYDLNKVRPQ